MKNIYLDNAAATPIEEGVIKAMSVAGSLYGNPSSFNDTGRKARTLIGKSRKIIAQFINACPGEVVFTASGSEPNNLAIEGVLRGVRNARVVTTPIEHPSVLEPLKNNGAEVYLLNVDKTGQLDIRELERALNTETTLVSVMYANNEIGTIQPIKKIAKIIAAHKKKHNGLPYFNKKACQALGYLELAGDASGSASAGP